MFKYVDGIATLNINKHYLIVSENMYYIPNFNNTISIIHISEDNRPKAIYNNQIKKYVYHHVVPMKYINLSNPQHNINCLYCDRFLTSFRKVKSSKRKYRTMITNGCNLCENEIENMINHFISYKHYVKQMDLVQDVQHYICQFVIILIYTH